MNNINHIYWFAPGSLDGPSTRYRGKYPLIHLKKHYDVTSDFVFPSRSTKEIINFLYVFISALLFRKKNSLIVIQKICTNRLYANTLKFLVLIRKNNTLYDIDDAEYLRSNTKTLHFFLKKCKSVSVGSSKLFDYCSSFNHNVYMQTSPVSLHDNRKSERNEKLTIGWVGDSGNGDKLIDPFSHKKSLFELFFTPILKINQPIKLILIGIKNAKDIPKIIEFFKDSPNIELEIPTDLNWKNDDWLYPIIAEFDVGIYPMVNHPFNQAKSAFKAKQYLSCCIPVIASDVGENNKFVHDNFNGIICNTPEDFKNAIIRFINMPDQEYFDLSKNCLKDIENYSIDGYCKKLIETHSNAIQHNV
jgi:glycosyltransferase involved in cell wall biosynthesis